jgi:hypothetical protein
MSHNTSGTDRNDPDELDAEVAHTLKENRYQPGSDTLTFTEAERDSFRRQQQKWHDYFSAPDRSRGLLRISSRMPMNGIS